MRITATFCSFGSGELVCIARGLRRLAAFGGDCALLFWVHCGKALRSTVTSRTLTTTASGAFALAGISAAAATAAFGSLALRLTC